MEEIKKDNELTNEISDEVVEQAEPTPTPAIATPIKSEPEIVDVDLGFVEKKRFRINGDYNRMLELNVSDLHIATRLRVGYPKLQKLLGEAQKSIAAIPEKEDELEELGALADTLMAIDKEMRSIIDYIFDTNASEICAPSGSMYDPVGSDFRFVHIIETLANLYSTGLADEFNKVKNKVESKTSKYTGKKKK